MNPDTGELRRLMREDKTPEGFEEVRGNLFRRIAEQELRAASTAGRESAVINLQSRHPLANWAKKKRKQKARAKIAAASRRRNRNGKR